MAPDDGADPAAGDALDRDLFGALRVRRLIIATMVTVFLALPAGSLLAEQGLTGTAAFLVPGTVVFVVMVDRWVLVSLPQPGGLRSRDLVMLWVVVVLGANRTQDHHGRT